MKRGKIVPKRESRKKSGREKANAASFARLAAELAEIGKGFYGRGWVLGTSGNFSAVVSREPLRLAITSTGLDKGELTAGQFLEMDDVGGVVRGDGRRRLRRCCMWPWCAA